MGDFPQLNPTVKSLRVCNKPAMMAIDFISLSSVLVASLLGSPHCAAMCGGFTTLAAGTETRGSLQRIAIYHFGRLGAYLLAGLGAFQLSNLVSPWLVGSLLIGVGIVPLTGLKITPPFIHRSATLFYRKLISLVPRTSKAFPLIIGLSSAFLPCGWLYIYVGIAASQPAPLITMAVFWLGTLPILTLWSRSSTWILSRAGHFYPPLRAILLVGAGLLSIAQHSGVLSSHDHASHNHRCH